MEQTLIQIMNLIQMTEIIMCWKHHLLAMVWAILPTLVQVINLIEKTDF